MNALEEIGFRTVSVLLPDLKDLEADCGAVVEGGETVVRDVWHGLLVGRPDLNSPHVRVLRALARMPEWHRLRDVTMADDLLSALGTLALADAVKSLLELGENAEHPSRTLPEVDVAGVTDDAALLDMFGFGLDVDTKTRLDKLEVLRGDRMREIIDAMVRIEKSLPATNPTAVRSEVVGITLGRDLPNVLPSELVLLAEPDAEIEFYRRYVSGELLQWDVKKNENAPVVLVRDSSGSMTEHRQVWAAAVGLAGIRSALAAGRRFVGIVFSDSVEVFRFPGADVLEFALLRLGGGTNYPAALGAALEEGGDIIFITDGGFENGNVEAWFNAERKSRGVTCHGVGVRTDLAKLKPWCDTVTSAEALNEKESKEVLQWCR